MSDRSITASPSMAAARTPVAAASLASFVPLALHPTADLQALLWPWLVSLAVALLLGRAVARSRVRTTLVTAMLMLGAGALLVGWSPAIGLGRVLTGVGAGLGLGASLELAPRLASAHRRRRTGRPLVAMFAGAGVVLLAVAHLAPPALAWPLPMAVIAGPPLVVGLALALALPRRLDAPAELWGR